MTFVETRNAHIVLDEKQVPYIAGTTTKVIELVLDQMAYGWSPEEMHFQFPYLSLGQIHSALAYYWDHQAEIATQIAEDLAEVEAVRQAAPPTPLHARLRAKGLI